MGRSASHIALECALLTQINYALIGEEVQAKKQTLSEVVNILSDLICARSKLDKNYGVILVPEGLIEFIPEVSVLFKELNEILSKQFEGDTRSHLAKNLTESSLALFNFLPKSISDQLLLDRDPHGNVQVAKIDTERLLILLITSELNNRKSKGEYNGKFSPQSHYFGYEGRCALPSFFDTEYCYGLGYNAGALVQLGFTGYMSVLRGVKDSNPENWIAAGCPLMSMMNVERRKGKDVPVIKKALVELEQNMFIFYSKVRDTWGINDSYISPGPIQYEGPCCKSCPYLVNPPDPSNINLRQYEIIGQETNQPYSVKSENNISSLSKYMLNIDVPLPKMLGKNSNMMIKMSSVLDKLHEEVRYASEKQLKYLYQDFNQRFFAEVIDNSNLNNKILDDEMLLSLPKIEKSLRIGICYNGRQAPGGNNIINGMLKFKEKLQEHFKVELFGFLNGTSGLFSNKHIEITNENYKLYLNHGGFDFLGRSADKIRSKEEIEKVASTCDKLNLDGLILVGATHTLSDSLLVSNSFLENSIKTRIITVPCAVDGNVYHSLFEETIGFDTASKVYSQLIGNIMTDSASATKYWYFM